MFNFWLSSDCCVLRSEECQGDFKCVTVFVCCLEEMFLSYFAVILLFSSPVGMHSCKEQAHLYIGFNIPGDKCPCSVLHKIMCACATFCPGVNSRLSYLMKFPLQVSLFIVSELSMIIGAFWTVVCSSTLQRVLCFKSRRAMLTALINVGLNSGLVSLQNAAFECPSVQCHYYASAITNLYHSSLNKQKPWHTSHGFHHCNRNLKNGVLDEPPSILASAGREPTM